MPRDVNLISPTTLVIANSPAHRLVRTTVMLDPNDAHHLSGKKGTQNEELLPSKPQLLQLAYAAGISFTKSDRMPVQEKNVVSWQVAGWVKNAMGDKLEDTATYTLDMRYTERPDPVDGSVIIRAVTDNLKKREYKYLPKDAPAVDATDDEWYKWARKKAIREIVMIDRFRDQRAETGAKLRLIRNFCNLKSKYLRTDLEKPFEVVRASFDISMAMQIGGPFQRMAESLVMGMAADQFGIPQEVAMKYLPDSETATNIDERMMRLTDKEARELVEEMLEAGFVDRAACDRKTADLYGLPVSSLTNHQANLLREQIELVEIAKDVMGKEEQRGFFIHMNNATRLASSELTRVVDVMEQDWYDKLYPQEEKEEEENPEPALFVPFFPASTTNEVAT